MELADSVATAVPEVTVGPEALADSAVTAVLVAMADFSLATAVLGVLVEPVRLEALAGSAATVAPVVKAAQAEAGHHSIRRSCHRPQNGN